MKYLICHKSKDYRNRRIVDEINIDSFVDTINGDSISTVNYVVKERVKEIAEYNGYSIDDLEVIPALNDETIEAIKKIIDYMYKDEEKDYCETHDNLCVDNDGNLLQRSRHIFNSVYAVARYFNLR